MVSYLNRRTILSLAFLGLTLFVVFGCAKTPQNIQNSTSKTIFFSTKDFKFYDLGFIKTYPNHTTLEIFNAGVLLLQMECYANKVCLNQTCYSKDSFMRRLLGDSHFDDLDLQAVLLGNEIFFGQTNSPMQAVLHKTSSEATILYLTKCRVILSPYTFKIHKSKRNSR